MRLLSIAEFSLTLLFPLADLIYTCFHPSLQFAPFFSFLLLIIEGFLQGNVTPPRDFRRPYDYRYHLRQYSKMPSAY